MPKPLTRPSFASLTWRACAWPVSCRSASTMPRKPPAAPACPTERVCTRFAQDHRRHAARERYDAVEQMQWLGDRPRRQVLFQRQRFIEKRVRILQRVGALRHAQLAEILARRAVDAHVVRREKS